MEKSYRCRSRRSVCRTGYRFLVLVSACTLLIAVSGAAEPRPDGWHQEKGAAAMMSDSQNVRLVGQWPFGVCLASANDADRGLLFSGSGGGVYVLDLSDPGNPVKISEAIKTRGQVMGLSYRDSILYV
ncbi:MAG: hypothetical protein WBH55_06445, partial [Bacteroidota bacterium]